MSSQANPPSLNVSNVEAWSQLLHSHQRPLLVHLNADTTWLIQLPFPAAVTPPAGRTRFNILIDPWLQGPQSDLAWWFSTQWHVVPPSFATIAELNVALRKVEGPLVDEAVESLIDAVVVSHEFTDHCHRATLEQLPRDTPVFASDVAAALIRSWGHFSCVLTTQDLKEGEKWTALRAGALPSWLGIGRITSPGNAQYFHSAMLIAIGRNPELQNSTGEAIIYSPHGIDSQDLSIITSSGLHTLALLHGMHDVRLWMMKQLNLGARNGIRAAAASGARYWIATHDEVKTSGGVIALFLKRTIYTMKEAVEHQESELAKYGETPSYTFVELESGDVLVLN
ncbi:hypothetical protein EDB81DRAFT_151087 [Dactylonectria macrodidyma]|uniref:Metallo-beta-lactamase domain-containing protein n=1 Tax=Dactylonectria macrodidyma TaxID=307937 RepID=A0A9P9FPK7_9HYPO|nr:hypothetical protein EDB81DRAFT_151087 [Dactylonectria macrodidyma]